MQTFIIIHYFPYIFWKFEEQKRMRYDTTMFALNSYHSFYLFFGGCCPSAELAWWPVSGAYLAQWPITTPISKFQNFLKLNHVSILIVFIREISLAEIAAQCLGFPYIFRISSYVKRSPRYDRFLRFCGKVAYNRHFTLAGMAGRNFWIFLNEKQ